jgi:hypothetical protein
MRHCYRGRGVFRLRAFLESINPSEVNPEIQTYSASSVPAIDIRRLVYFSTSVFWRASVQDWYVEGLRYQAISWETNIRSKSDYTCSARRSSQTMQQ